MVVFLTSFRKTVFCILEINLNNLPKVTQSIKPVHLINTNQLSNINKVIILIFKDLTLGHAIFVCPSFNDMLFVDFVA